MKRSDLIGLSLTLIMLLLVLGAAFIFLFQGRRVLEQQVDALATESETLRQEVAQMESVLMVMEATRLAVEEALATAESDAVLLEGELVASQQEADVLATRVAELMAGQEESANNGDQSEQQRTVVTPAPPRVEIVAPEDGSVFAAGNPIDIVVAAADPVGVTAVTLTIDDELFRSYTVIETALFTTRESWTPALQGIYTLGAIAVNSQGLASETVTTTLIISSTTQTAYLLSPIAVQAPGSKLGALKANKNPLSLPYHH